jgi:ABC-type phosphate transport system substrate-binding protein
MTTESIILLALYCLTATAAVSAREEVDVIVNAANRQKVTLSDLHSMYSGVVTRWANNEPIDLFELPYEAEAREIFCQKVMKMSAIEDATAWAIREINNKVKNAPMTIDEDLVPQFIANDPNAIGYVSEPLVAGKPGIRIIMTLSSR